MGDAGAEVGAGRGAEIDVVRTDVERHQRHRAACVVGLEEAHRRGELGTAGAVAMQNAGRGIVAVTGQHADGAFAATPELDQSEAADLVAHDHGQLVRVALVRVTRDPGDVGLHALGERVAERQQVAR